MAVRFAKSSSHSVVIEALSMKGSICPQRSRGEACKLEKSNEQVKLHLIKSSKNVCSPTADGLVLQACLLEAQGNQEPIIFGTEGHGCASKEILIFAKSGPMRQSVSR